MSEQKIILDVSSILTSEIGTSQSFPIREKLKDFDKEVKIINDLIGRVTINRFEEDNLLVFFNLKTSAEISCARCLQKFTTPLRLNYEQSFSVNGNEDAFPIMQNRTIDIFPSIRQEILLSIPIKPVCDVKCKGIINKNI